MEKINYDLVQFLNWFTMNSSKKTKKNQDLICQSSPLFYLEITKPYPIFSLIGNIKITWISIFLVTQIGSTVEGVKEVFLFNNMWP